MDAQEWPVQGFDSVIQERMGARTRVRVRQNSRSYFERRKDDGGPQGVGQDARSSPVRSATSKLPMETSGAFFYSATQERMFLRYGGFYDGHGDQR